MTDNKPTLQVLRALSDVGVAVQRYQGCRHGLRGLIGRKLALCQAATGGEAGTRWQTENSILRP